MSPNLLVAIAVASVRPAVDQWCPRSGIATLAPSSGTNGNTRGARGAKRHRPRQGVDPIRERLTSPKGSMDRRRVTLVVALVASLALVVGLSASLLGGVGTSSTETSTTVPRQQFFNIAQGITRFDDKDIQTMAATGVGGDRFLLDWAVVEPTQGSFDLARPRRWRPRLAGSPAGAVPVGKLLHGWPPPRAPPARQRVRRAGWRDFLKAAVARYGPGGSYWANEYRQQFGARPSRSRSGPGRSGTSPISRSTSRRSHRPRSTPTSLRSPTTRSRPGSEARIVLAGMPGFGKPKAWDFIDSLYAIPGFEGDFDAAALHPYAPTSTSSARRSRSSAPQ